MLLIRFGYTVLAILLMVGNSNAATMFSSLGPYDAGQGGGYSIGTVTVQNKTIHAFVAMAFTPAQTGHVGTVQFPYQSPVVVGGVPVPPVSGALGVEAILYNDAGGLPGSVLEVLSYSGPFEPFDDGVRAVPTERIVLSSVVHPVLTEGVRYWFALRPTPTFSAAGVWWISDWSPPPTTGAVYAVAQNPGLPDACAGLPCGTWNSIPAMIPQLLITDAPSESTIPEPSTLLLLTTALLLFGVCNGLRRICRG